VGKRSNISGQTVHRSAAQGRALVEQWRQSGLSVSEFCRRQAVGSHVLRYWVSREVKLGATAAKADAFYVVSAPGTESAKLGRPSVSGGSRASGAVIVVLPAVTSKQLVRTLRGLLEQVRA
jgi:transposase-like protein